jgi:hypothetical protein
MRAVLVSLALILIGLPTRAEEPSPGKLVQDLWEVAQVEGARTGYFRTTVREVERNGQKRLRTAQELQLTFRRGPATAQVRMESGDEETSDGKVLAIFMKQFQGSKVLVSTEGALDGDSMKISVSGDQGRFERKVRWNDQVIGLYAQELFFQKNKVKPGDSVSFQSFEPSLNAVLTTRAQIKDEEEVKVLETKRRLLRVELTPDKVELPGGKTFALPPAVYWLDKDHLVVRREAELPGLGKVLFTRASREVATAQGEATIRSTDILTRNFIPLDRKLPRGHDTSSVVYRITIKDEKEPDTALAQDERQQIKNVKGSSFELHVKAVREPGTDTSSEAKEEFTKSCLYLDSDNTRVQAHTKEAIGRETDAWKKALRIEGWVHDHMKIDTTAAFAPAGQVAQTLRGDCRQYGMLTAAMCRAAGVPSRTALGVVYLEDRAGKPNLAFHMWTEVWIKGRWIAIDATLGKGGIGAGHIKVTDASWHDAQSLTPFLPLLRVLDKLSVTVVQAE